jgi:hypothetical protein
MSSKFVFQPLELVTVTVVHGPVQFVAIVTTVPALTTTLRVGWPAHASVTVDAEPPPL